MKTFKKFLAEMAYSVATREYLDSRSKPYQFWLSGTYDAPLPFSAPMFRRIKSDNEDKKAIHITGGPGLESLFELQGSSKAISVMTKIFKAQAPYLISGIETSGGYIVELEGNMIMIGEEDIFTSSDSDGMRWMDLRHFKNVWNKQLKFTEEYEKTITKVLEEIRSDFETSVSVIGKDLADKIREYGENQMNGRLKWALQKTNEANEAVDWGKKFLNLKNTLIEEKELNSMISDEEYDLVEDYEKEVNKALFQVTKKLFDNAENYIKSNFEEFSNIFTKAEQGSYNEGVMNNFTIKKIHVDTRPLSGDTHVNFLETNLKTEISRGRGIPIEKHADMTSWDKLLSKYTWEMAGKKPAIFKGH